MKSILEKMSSDELKLLSKKIKAQNELSGTKRNLREHEDYMSNVFGMKNWSTVLGLSKRETKTKTNKTRCNNKRLLPFLDGLSDMQIQEKLKGINLKEKELNLDGNLNQDSSFVIKSSELVDYLIQRKIYWNVVELNDNNLYKFFQKDNEDKNKTLFFDKYEIDIERKNNAYYLSAWIDDLCYGELKTDSLEGCHYIENDKVVPEEFFQDFIIKIF